MRRLGLETLEPRIALSGNSPSDFTSGNGISVDQQSTGVAVEAVAMSNAFLSKRAFLSSSQSEQALANRWDWLAQTSWYVPPDYLLAYTVDSQLANPSAITDQTLWNVTQSTGGQIAGESVAMLSSIPVPIKTSFTGIVTPGGQVRIEFVGQNTTTGIGQMRFVQGEWRVEMQMVTGSDSLITHWAYMSRVTPGVSPPEPISPPQSPSRVSDNWRWIDGTHWALEDSSLFDSQPGAGVFQINSFNDGYFWGSGTGSQPFNVLGSVTPEGNLLFLISQDGAQPAVRTGILTQTGPASGTMLLRSYLGQPAIGSAWTIADPTSLNLSTLGWQDLLASS